MRTHPIGIPAVAFLFAIVLFANNARAHLSGIDLCDDVDGIDYATAKKILHDKRWVPDIPKISAQSQYSQYPELFCVRGASAPCEVTFRKGKGFIVLEVKKYASDKFAVEKCY